MEGKYQEQKITIRLAPSLMEPIGALTYRLRIKGIKYRGRAFQVEGLCNALLAELFSMTPQDQEHLVRESLQKLLVMETRLNMETPPQEESQPQPMRKVGTPAPGKKRA